MIMGKLEVYKTIIDKEIPYEKLADKIRIDDFVNAFEDKNQLLNDNGIKITYGVNVRISNNSEKDILPFSYSSTDFDSVSAAKEVDSGKNIPDFLKEYHLKEVTFCAKYNSLTKNYDISFIDDILEDVLGIKVSRIFSPFYDRGKSSCDISTFFLSCNSFLHVNIKYLNITSEEPVYVWICGEDPDVSLNVEKSYLATIVAITNRHDALKYFIRKKRLDILKFIMLLKSRRTDDFYIKQREEAVKSAKAAIMSRNMSHNLGSHVMSYLKQHLGSVKDMLNDRVLSEIIERESTSYKDPGSAALPFLVGLGHFISYLQERQDFIATIATDYIPYFSTVNFKDFIYDELNPDKRAERHSEWTANLKMDNILLGNIARSEGLGRPTRPTIEFDAKKKQEKGSVLSDIVLKFGKNFNGSLPAKGSLEEKDLEFMRTINVSLPGGIVGRQAFFSVVENIIRNAAKHGDWRKHGKLELSFCVYTLWDLALSQDSCPIPNDDNEEGCKSLKGVLEDFYKSAKDSRGLYFVTITDNCDFSLDSLGKLRRALLDDYIDNKGGMRNGNKGLKEIKISSAWLRAIRNENNCYCPYSEEIMNNKENIDSKLLEKDIDWNVNEGDYDAPLVYARISAKRGKKTGNISERNLQYIICLSIPRKVAIISDKKIFSQSEKEVLRKKNWLTYTVEEFKSEKNKSYEFIICDDDKDNSRIYSDIRPIATSRVCSMLQIPEIDRDLLFADISSGNFNSEKYELSLYKYLADFQEGDYISIDDHSAKERYENGPMKDDNPLSVLKIDVNDKLEYSVFAKDKDGTWSVDLTMSQEIKKYNLLKGTYYKVGRVFIADTYCCGNYIYRKHNETAGEFKNFMKSRPHYQGFVEGITGNNSTDRIIRNEQINDLWFYRNLHAMKSQIAIFDERLFAKIMGIEETNFTKGYMQIATTDNINMVKESYKTRTNDTDLMEYIDGLSLDKLNNSYHKLKGIFYKDTVESKGFLGSAYAHKGIFVFTLISDINNDKECKVNNKYYLIGVHVANGEIKSKEDDNYECICTTLAELSYSKESGMNVSFKNKEEEDYYKNKFNYITIHQGLLDKLYEDFGIKGSETENTEKKNITMELYKSFSKVQEKDRVNMNDFLPGLMVHSGRSKPGENDMPQKLPFIQYAALEHSVLDCKYTLVELLDHSRYEK